MPERMQLTDGVDTITFSPLVSPEYDRDDSRYRGGFEPDSGDIQLYDLGGAQRHNLALNDLSKADADQLNLWWRNMTRLSFKSDLTGAPGTAIQVRIQGTQAPFQMDFPTGFQGRYEGALTIHEVSSSSSSSGA